ncbi:IL-1 receptor fragment [Camelpox virus]|uniref:IL-1 receptor n=2 Tax=Camelpox virus TaxID=28873 RepID=Q8V2I6_CAMPM|nr:hypothetical protein CamMLVgp193 [Camelpox virus]AAG37697.1 CMP190.5aR [Camelpox virus CMS]AAL73900.1 IL-1 receptor fragment [Camelpox virus M-96]
MGKRGADNDRIILIDNGNNMLILNQTQSDSGIYMCITKNETYYDVVKFDNCVCLRIKYRSYFVSANSK